MPVDLKKLPAVHIVNNASASVVDLPISSFVQEIPNSAADDIRLRMVSCSKQDLNLGNGKVIFLQFLLEI